MAGITHDITLSLVDRCCCRCHQRGESHRDLWATYGGLNGMARSWARAGQKTHHELEGGVLGYAGEAEGLAQVHHIALVLQDQVRAPGVEAELPARRLREASGGTRRKGMEFGAGESQRKLGVSHQWRGTRTDGRRSSKNRPSSVAARQGLGSFLASRATQA